MTVTDFVLLNRGDRRVLARHLGAVLDAWRDDWFAGDAARADVTLADGDAAAILEPCVWRTGVLPDGVAVSAGIPSTSPQPLVSRLVGERACASGERRERASIERELEQSAVEDLIVRLLRGAVAQVTWDAKPPDAEVGERGRGFAIARCRLETTELLLVLHPRVTHDVLAANPPAGRRAAAHLNPVHDVAAARKVSAEVCVGSVELPVSELAGLVIGDVVTLERRLAEPVDVRLAEDGGALCRGYLGIFQGRKAVQLTITESNDGVEA